MDRREECKEPPAAARDMGESWATVGSPSAASSVWASSYTSTSVFAPGVFQAVGARLYNSGASTAPATPRTILSSPAASSPQSFSSSSPSSLSPARKAGPRLPLFVAIALAAAFAAVAVQGAWHLARPEAAPQPGRAANLASLADRGLAEPLQPLVSMEATKTQGRKARSPLKMPKAPPQPAPKRRRRQEKAGEAGSGEESALVMQREWEAAAEDCTDEQPIMLLDGCFMKIQAGPCAAKAIRGAQRGARNIGLAVENFVRSHKDEIKVAATAALGAVVAAATFAFEDR